MLKSIRKYLKFRYFLYIFSLIAGWPCVFFLLGWVPDYKINYILLLVLTFFFIGNKGSSLLPKPIVYLIVFQIIGWLFYSVLFFDSSYITRVYVLITTYLLLCIQVYYKNLEFIKTYNFWLTIQAIAGTIGVILVILGILQPLISFTEFDGRPGLCYGLFTTNSFNQNFCRNAGYFDEPGALAFWGIYALLFNKLFINNSKIEKLLLFGLISTLSMAYFIQIPIYLMLFYKKHTKKLLLLITAFLVTIKCLSLINEDFNRNTIGRFKYNEETGTLEGDNRSEQTGRALEVFKTAPIFGVGARNLSDNVTKEKGFMGANIFGSWASDGLVGQLLIYSPLIYLFILGTKSKKYLYAAIILAAGFLQRPYGSTQLICPLVNFTLVLHAYIDIYRRNDIRQDGVIRQCTKKYTNIQQTL